jgi:hypothetical protein
MRPLASIASILRGIADTSDTSETSDKLTCAKLVPRPSSKPRSRVPILHKGPHRTFVWQSVLETAYGSVGRRPAATSRGCGAHLVRGRFPNPTSALAAAWDSGVPTHLASAWGVSMGSSACTALTAATIVATTSATTAVALSVYDQGSISATPSEYDCGSHFVTPPSLEAAPAI